MMLAVAAAAAAYTSFRCDDDSLSPVQVVSSVYTPQLLSPVSLSLSLALVVIHTHDFAAVSSLSSLLFEAALWKRKRCPSRQQTFSLPDAFPTETPTLFLSPHSTIQSSLPLPIYMYTYIYLYLHIYIYMNIC